MGNSLKRGQHDRRQGYGWQNGGKQNDDKVMGDKMVGQGKGR